jgi:methyl-accepting chemotaxis protein
LLAPVKSLGYVNLSVAGIVVFLATLVILLVVRSTVKPINRMVVDLTQATDQVSSGSGEVASTSQQLAEGASQQAASIEETGSVGRRIIRCCPAGIEKRKFRCPENGGYRTR